MKGATAGLVALVCGGLSAAPNCPAPARTPEELLALAERTYAYVAKSVPTGKLARLRRELDVDAKWLDSAGTNDYERAIVAKQLRSVRRRILFAHPDLQFDKLLVNQRGLPFASEAGMTDQYTGRFSRPGPGLCVLENWRTAPRKRVLLAGKLPKGCTLNPNLHWDADRVVFAFNDHEAKPPCDPKTVEWPTLMHLHEQLASQRNLEEWFREADPTHPGWNPAYGSEADLIHHHYWIYEAATDGSWVRRLTGGPNDPKTTKDGRQTVIIDDADPCYLPNGDIVFNSTRSQSFGRCHGQRYNPSFLLYAMDGNGGNIRPFSFGEANEWSPFVLNDGRIVYTRWDYIHRHPVRTTGLWTVRPDGTAVAHHYGSYSLDTYTVAQARPLPGSTKVIAVASAHHMFTAGSLIIVDVNEGEDGPGPITRVTPEVPYPESQGALGRPFLLPGTWNSPMPVNDTLFFASYSDDPLWYPDGHPRAHSPSWCAAWPGPKSYGVWLVDTLGGRELIYQDPEWSTFDPMPLVKRAKPPVLASNLPPADKAPPTGTCYLADVYNCRTPFPRGSVKAIRVNRIVNQPTAGHPLSGRIDIYKETLGTVPVAEDGSCAFEIPAGEPLQLQAVDAEGKAVMTMRSFIYSQKGERQGCSGCHETRATYSIPKKLMARKALKLTPEIDLGYTGVFRPYVTIKPIFDRKCLSCHGPRPKGSDPKKGPPDFSDWERMTLALKDRGALGVAVAYQETPESRPCDYFANASKLAKMLAAGHCKDLTEEELRKIYLWLDLNVVVMGCGNGYSFNVPELRRKNPEGEAKLRAAVKEVLGEGIASQPFAALVNRGDTRLSRVLMLVPERERARFQALCDGALLPPEAQDVQGTCGRKPCRCRSCWVREGGYNK